MSESFFFPGCTGSSPEAPRCPQTPPGAVRTINKRGEVNRLDEEVDYLENLEELELASLDELVGRRLCRGGLRWRRLRRRRRGLLLRVQRSLGLSLRLSVDRILLHAVVLVAGRHLRLN